MNSLDKETKLQVRTERGLITPEAIRQEEEMRTLINQYIKKNLKKGVDYYELTIGGRKSKPSLSKPGSEKFMSLFHLRPEFEKDNDTWEMAGKKDGLICYLCKLYTKNGVLVGEGRGARDMAKDNGDANKAIKMAEKSAQIDAILRTGSLSELFTQDVEDMDITGVTNDPDTQVVQKKTRISKMLNMIHYRKITDKEEILHLIKEHTELEPTDENLTEIINRLSAILNEQREAQKQ